MPLSVNRLTQKIVEAMDSAEQAVNAQTPNINPKLFMAQAIAKAVIDEMKDAQITITARIGTQMVTVESVVVS
jgi:hypothetical protein